MSKKHKKKSSSRVSTVNSSSANSNNPSQNSSQNSSRRGSWIHFRNQGISGLFDDGVLGSGPPNPASVPGSTMQQASSHLAGRSASGQTSAHNLKLLQDLEEGNGDKERKQKFSLEDGRLLIRDSLPESLEQKGSAVRLPSRGWHSEVNIGRARHFREVALFA